MADMASRLAIVSAERIRTSSCSCSLARTPCAGIRLLVDTGLVDAVPAGAAGASLEVDEHHRHKDVYEHSLTVLEQAIELEEPARDAARTWCCAWPHCCTTSASPRPAGSSEGGGVTFHHHDIVGASWRASGCEACGSATTHDQVAQLVELHLRFFGYGEGEWTDSAVRRYVRDAGDQLARLHILTRADCTTRNKTKAAAAPVPTTTSSSGSRCSPSGGARRRSARSSTATADQAVLGIRPGPEVGEAYRFLLDLRMDRGPSSEADAIEALKAFWNARS